MTRLAISSIQMNGGTQSRRDISEETVIEYAEAMAAGAAFTAPIVVFFDGTDHWLADGFHRVNACIRLKQAFIECEVRKGTRRDAFFFGAKANVTHGLPRSNRDKRFAVETALGLEPEKSDRWIAEACAVSGNFVGDVRRAQLQSDDSSPARTGKDGKTRALPTKPEPAPKSPKRPIEIVRPEVSPLADESEPGEPEPADAVDPRLDTSAQDAAMEMNLTSMKMRRAAWSAIEAWRWDPEILLTQIEKLLTQARAHFEKKNLAS